MASLRTGGPGGRRAGARSVLRATSGPSVPAQAGPPLLLPGVVERLARTPDADRRQVVARELRELLRCQVVPVGGRAGRDSERPVVVERPGPDDRSFVLTTGEPDGCAWLAWRSDPFTAEDLRQVETIGWVLLALRLRRTGEPAAVGQAPPPLTPREREVLASLASGLTAEAIARAHAISPRTVRKHLEHVYSKLGASDRLVAVDRARAHGLLPLS